MNCQVVIIIYFRMFYTVDPNPRFSADPVFSPPISRLPPPDFTTSQRAMELRGLMDVVQDLRFVNYFDVASFTILVYNYILTFSQELDVIWMSRWTITKVFFVLTRYIPFFDMALLMYHLFSPDLRGHACSVVFQGTLWLFFICLVIAEGILTLRTWTIWGRSHPILNIVLPVVFAMFGVSELSMMTVFAKSLIVGPGVPAPPPSCLVTGKTHAIVICWTILMLHDAFMLAVMVTQGFKTFPLYGNSGLFKVAQRDGITYYCYIFALSILNIVIVLTQSTNYLFLFAPLECVIHSVLTANIIFHIRAEVDSEVIIN
ncbi:hypothetical protein BD779DRAFT_267657 [Infundibulicybe gibba]|nr:hypothetical protein BD779DRAFT_267657 [Infundibulicybe gibba]